MTKTMETKRNSKEFTIVDSSNLALANSELGRLWNDLESAKSALSRVTNGSKEYVEAEKRVQYLASRCNELEIGRLELIKKQHSWFAKQETDEDKKKYHESELRKARRALKRLRDLIKEQEELNSTNN